MFISMLVSAMISWFIKLIQWLSGKSRKTLLQCVEAEQVMRKTAVDSRAIIDNETLRVMHSMNDQTRDELADTVRREARRAQDEYMQNRMIDAFQPTLVWRYQLAPQIYLLFR